MARMTACAGLLAIWMTVGPVSAGEKSDAKVKATASATKPDANGKQTVTITLTVAKDHYVFANPVKLDLLEHAQTTVRVEAKVKPTKVSIVYPPGKTIESGRYKWDAYEGTVNIQADVQRAIGDSGPLEIIIDALPVGGNVCYLPVRIKLTVP